MVEEEPILREEEVSVEDRESSCEGGDFSERICEVFWKPHTVVDVKREIRSNGREIRSRV